MRSVSGFYRPTLRYSVPTKFRARCFLKCCVLPMGFASIGPLASRRRPPHPVLVHRLAPLLHASFRPHLAVTPLRFANPSPPSGWVEDFHLQAVEHARHTKTKVGACAPAFGSVREVGLHGFIGQQETTKRPATSARSLPHRRRRSRRRRSFLRLQTRRHSIPSR